MYVNDSSMYVVTLSSDLVGKMAESGMRTTANTSTAMARRATAVCPPVKHSTEPSTYHLCDRYKQS